MTVWDLGSRLLKVKFRRGDGCLTLSLRNKVRDTLDLKILGKSHNVVKRAKFDLRETVNTQMNMTRI